MQTQMRPTNAILLSLLLISFVSDASGKGQNQKKNKPVRAIRSTRMHYMRTLTYFYGRRLCNRGTTITVYVKISKQLFWATLYKGLQLSWCRLITETLHYDSSYPRLS